MAYWIGVAAQDHVAIGVREGFAQLGHGKHSAAASLKRDDWILYYAPRTGYGGGDAVQAFVALGQVTSDTPYQVEQRTGYWPFRVNVAYLDVRAVPIRPLLDDLNLTRGLGSKWGMAVRRSKIRSDAHDFNIIAQAMGAGARF